MDINKAFDILMEFEGGKQVTSIPQDRGGLTKYGISQAAYPSCDIKNLTEDTAKAMYGTDYWNTSNCTKLKPELQYVVFDTAVNCGPGTAIRILREACGISSGTEFDAEALVKSDNVSIAEYLLWREWYDDEIVEHRRDQIIFLGGWENRNKQILSLYKEGKLS